MKVKRKVKMGAIWAVLIKKLNEHKHTKMFYLPYQKKKKKTLTFQKLKVIKFLFPILIQQTNDT